MLEETEMQEEVTAEKRQNETEVAKLQENIGEGTVEEETNMPEEVIPTEKQQNETKVEVANGLQANIGEGKVEKETKIQEEVITTEKQQNGTEVEVEILQENVGEGKLEEETEMQEEVTAEKVQQNGTEVEATNLQENIGDQDKVEEETEMQEEVITTEKQQNKTEVEVVNSLQENIGDGKVEETCNKDSTKKPKQTSKQIQKAKVTVAKPFNLATEKRMSRERRGSMDFKGSNLALSKSTSLNYKNLSFGPERNSNLKRTGSSTTKTRSKPNVPTEDKVSKNALNGTSSQEKVHAEEAKKKKAPVAVKNHEGNELTNSKLQKNSTFKALPLPRFYHQEDIHPEVQKKKVTHSKPPLASELGKTVAKSDHNIKIEEKGKKVSRKIGVSAKETISKLFRTTKGSLGTPKEKAMDVVSSS